jgi:hypothetical protein
MTCEITLACALAEVALPRYGGARSATPLSKRSMHRLATRWQHHPNERVALIPGFNTDLL